MKILICGDTHLGRKNFKVDEREKDFENSFTEIIDYALKNCKAVIHAGDLFDTGRPSVRTLLFTIKELKRLKEQNIPVFIIAGSHDISVDESFLNVLDKLGLVIHVSEKKNYTNFGGKIVLKGESFNGLFVAGLYAKDSNIVSALEVLNVEFPKEPCFKIFLFHHIISDISTLFSTIKKSSLPKGFDLYVSGHWHERFETEVYNKKLLYAGSTENWDFREVSGEKKGFFMYDTDNNKYEFIKLKIRDSEIISVECSNKTTDEVKELLLSKIGEGNGKMLFFMLKGRLKSGIKSTLNKQEVYDAAMKKGYLLCKVYDGELENPNEEQVSVKTRSVNEIEGEFFKNKGFSDDELKISLMLLDLLGKDCSNSERDKLVEEAINYSEAAFK
ncbi:DNA double-strand break repair protein Mre11 [Candidatus Tiddalikarchaeum anstoanum]|nr:DNA double-strand break repair protein Mre11 [Candidatus Tiddalikarchaeum anstoanum]